MHLYYLLSLIVVIALGVEIVNRAYFKVQPTIAVTIGGLGLSLILMALQHFHWLAASQNFINELQALDFKTLLLNGLLGILLFAGAMTVEIKQLKKYRWEIGILAVFGTLASTLLVGFFLFTAAKLLGVTLPFIICLLFGAIISPTDPIAVLATLKEVKAPSALTAKIAGESLFNDGIGLVLFVTLYTVVFASQPPTLVQTCSLFLREALGGLAYGWLLGVCGTYILKRLNQPRLQLMVTLSIATAAYVLAQTVLEISGPLAMVVAGLMIGNTLRTQGQHTFMEAVWELLDEFLNAILFILIGFELLIVPVQADVLWVGLISIVLVLLARFFSVALPMACFKRYQRYSPYVITILTWGGLRGGLALAMALSLPQGDPRNILLLITYLVVTFSIVVQGLSAKSVVRLSKQHTP